MTRFEDALAIWRDYSDLRLSCDVWRWTAADGTPRGRVTLVACHDGRLVDGVHVSMKEESGIG